MTLVRQPTIENIIALKEEYEKEYEYRANELIELNRKYDNSEYDKLKYHFTCGEKSTLRRMIKDLEELLK